MGEFFSQYKKCTVEKHWFKKKLFYIENKNVTEKFVSTMSCSKKGL